MGQSLDHQGWGLSSGVYCESRGQQTSVSKTSSLEIPLFLCPNYFTNSHSVNSHNNQEVGVSISFFQIR